MGRDLKLWYPGVIAPVNINNSNAELRSGDIFPLSFLLKNYE